MDSASYLFYVISGKIYICIYTCRYVCAMYIQAYMYIPYVRTYMCTPVGKRLAEGYRLEPLPRAPSSSVLSPSSFSPRPTSDLGEWNKFRVSEKLESLGGRRHFPWTPGKLLIPRHLLFNQGRVSTRARWEEGELGSEADGRSAATLPSGYR